MVVKKHFLVRCPMVQMDASRLFNARTDGLPSFLVSHRGSREDVHSAPPRPFSHRGNVFEVPKFSSAWAGVQNVEESGDLWLSEHTVPQGNLRS